MPYKLSATLSAHTSDVRALTSPTNDLVLSASRDSTAISWRRSTTAAPFEPVSVLKAGNRYINAVAYLPPSPDAPRGYVVTGGQESVINVFSLESPKTDPDFSLIGHADNVCTLDVTLGGAIVSGSWDMTAKVWRDFRLVYDLKGHQQSVWAVLAIDEQHILTGSADKTIKLWQQHKNVRTYRGHQDAVRGLALIPDIGFASCSNDSEIRVWTLEEGDHVYTLSGHTSFVYTLSVLPNGDIVSGGEDRTVRIWRDAECSQTIVHPAISVWAVATMPNGDIVSGCSDGIIRIFSAVEERWASQVELQEYDDKVAAQALPSQVVGDVKKADLPGLEALNAPGRKDGEVKMVTNGDNVEAHQWDSSSLSWVKIGDVVDAVGSSRKQLYEGKEYDYVFDVDIQDGVPPLKLPYNVAENPYGAAQRFLERNELPPTYVDQVVQFIEKNTAGVNIGTGDNEYVDPYTGASRYRSSSSSVPTLAPASSTYMDPFTGASRYSGPVNEPPAAAVGSVILPVSRFVIFKQANVSAMQGKLHQFDEALRNEISTSPLAMYPQEMDAVDEIFAYLSKVVTSARPSTPLTTKHVDAVIHILDRWPPSQRFPVIDLSRLVTGFCPDIFASSSLRERFLQALFNGSDWVAPWSLPLSRTKETNILLLFRTLANVFQDGAPINDGAWVKQVFESLSQASYVSLTKVQRVALATILFNFSCLCLGSPVDGDIRDQHLNLILRVLQSEKDDSEAVYRTLVGLGNIAYSTKTFGTVLDSGQTHEIAQCVRILPGIFPEDRIRNIGEEVSRLLQWL